MLELLSCADAKLPASIAAPGVRVGEDNTWAVFPPEGAAFTVTLRPMFRLMAVAGGRLYGYVDEGGGEPFVAVYELR